MNRKVLAVAVIAASVVFNAVAQEQEETKEQRDARMKWWREAKFGMFIHWGIYSVPAGTYDGKQIGGIGEWIMNRGKIPVDVYAKYAEQFNPVKFNAEEWVRIAKNAGMKYMVITSKHHDGFAMFKSEASKYNIFDATPYKKDPLKDLAEACRKEGIKLGFYYSQAQDWHHKGGAAAGGHWDKEKQDGSMDEYIDKIAIPQVREILSNYGEFPAVLWWDTPCDMNADRAARLYKVMKELKPGIIWNNRLGGGYKGDTETPEQHIPPQGYPGRDWETCMTMNGTWGYKSYDDNWKSTETLIRNLCDIASKNGNYLLNVGPTSEGLIPQPSIDRLAEVGKWMKANSEAIYGTGPTPFGDECGSFNEAKKDKKGKPAFETKWDWRCTAKGNKLYFHIFKWPGEKFEVAKMKGKAVKAYMLADEKRTALKVTQDGDKMTVALPSEAPDKIASVLCVETE
jgi:alpha-L-fucosidase